MNNIGAFLLKKGRKFCSYGKIGIFSFITGFVLAILICLVSLIGWGKIYFFNGLRITAFLWYLTIFLTAVGGILAPLYFLGLHYMGLGRLNLYNDAICQHLKNQKVNMSDELPDL